MKKKKNNFLLFLYIKVLTFIYLNDNMYITEEEERVKDMGKIILKENNNLINKQIIDRYLNYIDVCSNTSRAYEVGLRQFTEYIKEKGINIPTRDNIIEYRDYLIEKHKPKTVNLYLTALKNFYSWLEYEEITKNITKNIKNIKLESIHLKRGLSKEEIVDVLNSCKDLRETLLIKLMITCALRVNEVCNIQLSDFFNDNGVVMLKVLGKGRQGLKQDVVKIDDRIYELIKEYVNQYGIKDYLFVSTSNNSLGKSISTTAMRKIVNNIFKRANLDMEMLSPHSTRHTSVELALESGLSIQEVSQMVRHKNIQTTIVYSKELEKRNSKFANVLADMIF